MTVSAQDVVGVFDANFNQLFVNARAMRALVSPEAKIMEHPLETGAQIADHIVYLPVEIELSFILDPATARDTYQEIKSTFKAATIVSVQTKADTFSNMVIKHIPHDEVPEMFDTFAVAMKLREAQFVQPQYAQLPANKVKKPANSSTVKTGEKTSTTPALAQQSAAVGIWDSAKNFFGL